MSMPSAPDHFVLHAAGELPVVLPGIPAGEDGRVIGGRARDLRTEAKVGDLPAGVDAAGGGRALRQRIDQVAVRREVAVGVGPRPGHARDDPVAGRNALGRIESQPVLADVRLDGRSTVAEDVVGDAHARREVLELVEVLLVDREVPVRHQRPWAEVILVPAGVVVVVTQAGVHREPVDGPPVLDEGAHLGAHAALDPHVLVLALGDLVRDAVAACGCCRRCSARASCRSGCHGSRSMPTLRAWLPVM